MLKYYDVRASAVSLAIYNNNSFIYMAFFKNSYELSKLPYMLQLILYAQTIYTVLYVH